MKIPLKGVATMTALVVIAIAYAQQRNDAELRIVRLEQALEQFAKVPRSIEHAAQDRLLQQVAAEVIFLHHENAALRKEMEQLKPKR